MNAREKEKFISLLEFNYLIFAEDLQEYYTNEYTTLEEEREDFRQLSMSGAKVDALLRVAELVFKMTKKDAINIHVHNRYDKEISERAKRDVLRRIENYYGYTDEE